MKKALYIVSVVVVAIILVVIMLLGALASPRVQTAAVQMVTADLTRALGTRASIRHIEYRFPARISVQGIYVEDMAGDTLLYVDDLYAHFRPMQLLAGNVCFSTINIHQVRANAYQLENGEYNYQYLVDLFSRERDEEEPSRDWAYQLNRTSLSDIRVRYDDKEIYLDNSVIKLQNLSADSIDADILTLTGLYSDGVGQFELEDLSARLKLNDTLLSVPTLYVRLPHSEIDASGVRIAFPAGDTLFLSQSARDIHTRLYINKAELCPADLGVFVPSIATLDGKVSFHGELEGSLDSLSATNLAVFYNDYRLIHGDISVVGLPHLENTYLTAHCDELAINANVAQDFISDLQNKPYRLPAELRRLGNTRYRGTIEGHLTDLALHGAFRTDLGTITTDGRLISDTTFTKLRYNGRIATRRFRLGRMLPNSGLGNVTFDISANGYTEEGQFPSGSLHAHIRELQFRNYTYQDICLNGHYSAQRFDGELNIHDDNIQLDITGLFQRIGEIRYDFDLRLSRFEPQALHLTEQDVALTTNMHVNLSGFDPDKMSGYLVLDSLRLRNMSDSLLMRQLSVIVESDTTVSTPESRKSIVINSDYLTAKVWGNYAYTTLPNSIQRLIQRYLPSIYSPKQAQQIAESRTANDIHFYVYGQELKTLQRVLHLPWRIADYPVLRGEMNDRTGHINIQGHAENIRSQSRRFRELTFTLDNQTPGENGRSLNTAFSMTIPADTIIIAPKEHSEQPTPVYLPTSEIRLSAQAIADSVLVRLSGINMDSHVQTTDVALVTALSRYGGKPLFDVHFRPSQLQYFGETYDIRDSHLTYNVADTVLVLRNFAIESESQYIRAAGIASTITTDSLSLQLGNINAAAIMPFILNEKVLTVQGDLSGKATVFGAFGTPMFDAHVTLMDAGLNGQRLGDAIASLDFDKERKELIILGDIYHNVRDSLPSHHVAHVDGLVTPAERRWGLDITPDSIPLGFINHWTQAFLTLDQGTASGRVQVLGHMADVWVLARVHANDVDLSIPFTGCTYRVNDSVYMDSTAIRFPHMKLRDIEGNPVYVDGILRHESFKNFMLDISARPDRAMALNLPDVKGELLSGKVYANGEVRIWGPDKDIRLDASAATFGKSRLRLSIDGASSAHDNSFIRFVSNDSTQLILTEVEDEFASIKQEKEKVWNPDNKFTLSLGADVTPGTLLFQLMLNSATGDMIQARGDGSVRLLMDPNGDINLVGTYTLQSGSLGFTIGNVIRRDFTIAEGSQIAFTGNPENPTLDVTAKYRVTASLRDLFGEDISMLATSRTSVPVNCCVHMTGALSNPVIQFAIELPLSEDAIRNQVKSVINTDEMLMRQVVYLLIFGRFFTPEYLQNTGTTGVNEVYSILSSTITGQINSWLGKLTNIFTMGVNFRTDGEGAAASQEYEAQFQLQPVDRLVINGNVGYRYNDISNRPFFGDVDVEYMLTPNGKVRLKAYTHTVDKYSLRQATTIQGVGLLFRHDFNWGDARRRREERNRRKE